MPILDSLLSAFGLERQARGAATSGGARARAGAIPLSGWSAGYGYSGGYGSTSPVPSPFADTVPWHLNPVVAAGIAWFARNFPVPDLHVVRDGGADDGAEIDGHDLPRLFDKPNELWSFFDFFAASVMSDITDGNTFWLKRKDGKGAVVDLWWLEPWGVRIVADPARAKAILGYRYDSGDVHESYRPDEVLHVRAAQLDRVDPRRGMSPLSPVDRSIRVTNEVGRYDEAILKNGGASPGVFVPPDPKQPIPKEDIPGLQDWYKQNATGPNAGGPIFAPFGLNFLKTGFSPEEMSLDKLPRRHVSFILAAMGLSPMVLGYEDESKTYANFAEACRSAYENALMPMQARFAEAINHDDDLVAEGERLKWDYSHVTYLQDDRGAKIHSLVEAVGGPILEKNEARAELHYEPIEEPEPPAQPPSAPGADGTDGAADGSAAPAGIAALLAARGNGNGNGKVSAGATGNGKPARPAAKALTGPADPPTDAELARRTEAVLVALEAKLRGGRSRKANPHHDHSGRFAHGSGGGSGHAGLTAEGKPRVYGFDADVARSMVAELDEEAGGKHTLEFAHPETIRDRKALAKADAAGRPVAVRVTQAPEVEVRRGGDATEYLVGGEPHYTVRPHPDEPGHWAATRHYYHLPDDDFTFRTRAKAEAHAEGAVAKEVRVSTETAYATPRRLSNLDFVKYASAPGYRTNFHVLIPEGEPLPGRTKGADRAGAGPQAGPVVIDGIEVPMSRDGAGGPPADPFDPGPAIARIKALYRSGQLTRSAAVLAIKAVRRGACRDRRGRFASCGTGAATSQDVRHERDTRPGGTRAARELVTGAGEHAGAGTPKPKPGPTAGAPAAPSPEVQAARREQVRARMGELDGKRETWKAEVAKHQVDHLNDSAQVIGEKVKKRKRAERRLAEVEAEHARLAGFEARQREVPNAVPPGPIADRIKDYAAHGGEAKRQALLDGLEPIEARFAEHRAGHAKASAEYDRATSDLSAVEARHRQLIKEGQEPDLAEWDAAGDRARVAWGQVGRHADALTALEGERIAKVAEVLAVDRPVALARRTGLIRDKDGQTFRAESSGEMEAGLSFATRLTRAGDGGPIEVAVGTRAGQRRAHYFDDRTVSGSGNYIIANPGTEAHVFAHEAGHLIEQRTRTGDEPIAARSREFLEHRIGDETPRPMREVEPLKDFAADEMGRKDKFDSVFDRDRGQAYYVGKVYPGESSTEIISMGIEQLHRDAGKLARKDPEYFHFLAGVLGGELR